eukprot:scaffold52902_cov71-Phaeocystis_antarctica.AAC.3
MKTAREEVARDAVEVIEVAKASLDHGEQMLAIARQKAPRLASIEGCKLLRQQPPRLRLVIVRVRDEMDLDTLLVAAHLHTHARATNERFEYTTTAIERAVTPSEREELHDAPQP